MSGYEQVAMMGHQHVGVDGATALLRVLLEPVEIHPVVLLGKEARLAIVAALNKMLRHPGRVIRVRLGIWESSLPPISFLSPPLTKGG
jgi:hypothetical protein